MRCHVHLVGFVNCAGGALRVTSSRSSHQVPVVSHRVHQDRPVIGVGTCADAIRVGAQSISHLPSHAPPLLERAGLLEGRKFTCFPGVEEQIASGDHQTDLVVVDDNIVTSRGAGTALAFAYALVDLLGGDGQQLAHTMVYDRLFQ